jgi:signal transduction histidine kinase
MNLFNIYFRIVALVVLTSNIVLSQSNAVADSLISVLNTQKLQDTVKIKLYGDVSWELMGIDINKSLEYAKNELTLSKQLKREADIAQSESDIANVFNRMGEYDSALVHYNLGLLIREKLNQPQKVAGIYTNIATVLMRQNKFKEALEINFKTLKIFEENKELVKVANVLGNIGNIYYELNQYKSAEQFLRKGLVVAKEIKAPIPMSNILVNLGGIKFAEKNLDSALYYFKEGEKIQKENNLLFNLTTVYNNIGKIYLEKKEYNQAVAYYEKALTNREQLKDVYGIGLSCMNLGEVYKYKKDYAKSMDYLQRAEKIFISLHSFLNMKQIYLYMAQVAEEMNDYKKAFGYYKLYDNYKDSIYNKDNAEKMAEMQTKFETEKKDLEIAKQNAEIEATKSEVERKNIITYILVVSVLLVILLSYLFYNRYKLKQNALLDAELLKQQELRAKAIIEAEEKERMRIARDLHDGVGQTLSAAKLNLSGLENKLQLKEQESQMILKNVIDLVDDSVKEVRAVSHSMMPNALIKSGLVAAVREFINKLSSVENLKIDLEINGLNERLEQSAENVLFRLLQELVSNIIKHAKANYISIQLIKHDTELTLIVEDNGVGFDTKKLNEYSGIGLKNIISRVEFLKGSVDFDSTKGKGTTVVIEIPVQ